jgi:hypothetical protein
MEPIACLDMTVSLYNSKLCSIASICIDDDASTRSMMKWSEQRRLDDQQQNERATDVGNY